MKGLSEQPQRVKFGRQTCCKAVVTSMCDLNYTSQEEEIHELMSDPEFQALMNEPTDEELDAMADWYAAQGVAA